MAAACVVPASSLMPGCQKKVLTPPVCPLRRQIPSGDLATYDFLLKLKVFSLRDVRGDSILDPDHLDLRLRVGRKMMAEEESSLLKFEELLAQSFMNWNPMCVYVKRRLAVQFDARSGLEAATSQPIHPKSHCHSCLTCHAHSLSKQT